MNTIIEQLNKKGIPWQEIGINMIATLCPFCVSTPAGEPRATLNIDLSIDMGHCSKCHKDAELKEIAIAFDVDDEPSEDDFKKQKKPRTRKFFKKNIENKKDNSPPLILDRDINFGEVYNSISEIGIVEKETLYILFAIAISAQLRLNPPLWIFLVGVPSSFKTELVGLLGDMKEVYSLDTLTENAFASGFMPTDGSEPQDLLPLLDNKCFIVKDLNTIFSMNSEKVKKILGDLTSIFDGKFEKFTATRGMISHNSLFSMIGCVTPSILAAHHNYAMQLGPRFFFLRLPKLTKENRELSLKKFWAGKNRNEEIIKVRQLVSSYCTQLISKIKLHNNNLETEEIQDRINSIAQFICSARGLASTVKADFKNKNGEEITNYDIKDWQVEEPWRLLNQLRSLLKIISFILGKNDVDDEAIRIIRPIVLSTMPVARAQILSILIERCGISVTELGKEIKKSTKTIRRTMKELATLEIVDCYKDPKMNVSGNAPWLYFIVSEFASVLKAPIPSPEFLSQSKSLTDEEKLINEEDEEV